MGAIPTTPLDKGKLKEGIPAYELFALVGLTFSKSEARRLISQGGGYLNGERIESFEKMITLDDVREGSIILRAGKKRFHRVIPR